MVFRRATPQVGLPTIVNAIGGRPQRSYDVPERHEVLGTPLEGPIPDGFEVAIFGMGCFWGDEKMFWQLPGVWSTSVGYAGGSTPNPTYEEVCSSRTGHAEVVRIVFDPATISYADLLRAFWENHDPTQGMRQGNDIGSQYRSLILTTSDEQQEQAVASRTAYQDAMTKAGYGQITTTIEPLQAYFYAEAHHQQYLQKNPYGYCPIHATGIQYAE